MKFDSSFLPLAGACSLLLAGCGGGESSTSVEPTPPAATTAISTSGVITGFGSVIVNGVRYETTATEFSDDGDAISQDELAVGQFVRLNGEISASGEAHALSVERDDLLEGPISAIDAAAGRLVVLGQTVIVDADTSFDARISPASITGLAVGDWIEVDGLPGADDTIHATRIEPASAGGEMEVTGTVRQLDTAARTFVVGELAVDYSQATLEDFPSTGVAAGHLVEVKGNALGGGGELIATELELKTLVSRDDDDDDREVELEGYVTRFASASDFDVGGHRVSTSGSTSFEGGVASDLALGVKVVVEGSLDAAGTLVADEVEIRRRGDARITGAIEVIDAEAKVITVLGIDVQLDGRTRFEDRTALDDAFLSAARLAVGDWVEIHGYEDPALAGRVLATRLEREDDDDQEVELRGEAQAVSAPALTILGVQIETHAGTRFSDNDVTIDAATFFAQAAGRLVEVDGTWDGATLVAAEVELEDRAP